jgi:hypothetical protein
MFSLKTYVEENMGQMEWRMKPLEDLKTISLKNIWNNGVCLVWKQENKTVIRNFV